MQTFHKGTIYRSTDFKTFRKKRLTEAMRVDGPFEVITREGKLSCPDGYLALDSAGWPYPIAKEEFETIYEEVNR